jgi:hypothetical protein
VLATVLPYKCRTRGQYFGPSSVACPRCGCNSWDAAVSVQGVETKAEVGQLGWAARSLAEGEERIHYKSPAGTESSSEVKDGKLTLELRGTKDIGGPGEAAVIERIEDALRAQGHAVSRGDAEDERGEDGLIVCDDRTVIIQVVTAPGDPRLLAAAAKGVARTEDTRSAAASWLERAIDSKASRYAAVHKQSMLLAIDVRHVGVVIGLIDSNIRAKATTAGFAAVWLVGPTTDTTVRLS